MKLNLSKEKVIQLIVHFLILSFMLLIFQIAWKAIEINNGSDESLKQYIVECGEYHYYGVDVKIRRDTVYFIHNNKSMACNNFIVREE